MTGNLELITMHIIHTRVRPCIQYQNGVAENSHEKQRQEHYDKIQAKQILHGPLLEYQVCHSEHQLLQSLCSEVHNH